MDVDAVINQCKQHHADYRATDPLHPARLCVRVGECEIMKLVVSTMALSMVP